MRTEALEKVGMDFAPDFDRMSRKELDALYHAGEEALTCLSVLAKTGDNVVSELLRGHEMFYEWDHYPPGDVYDQETHAQYYYHAHPPAERFEGEHGHFHTFMRPKGMPVGVRPADVPNYQKPEDPNDELSHLIAIAMDNRGLPFRLFTVNRWVTGEVWYDAQDVIRMLDAFVIGHARPSWPTNRWLTAVVRLFRPQIIELIKARDVTVRNWEAQHPARDVYEDRELEVTSAVDITIDDQIRGITRALGG